jgi:peptide/nickel transport system substrate-binding protein
MIMKRKILWILVIFLMVLSLVIASCGTKAEEETKVTTEVTEKVVVTTEEEEEEEEVAEKEGLRSPEEPKYGGVFVGGGGDPVGFDTCYFLGFMMPENMIMFEGLTIANWAKGPAGTGETDWTLGHLGKINMLIGGLAESWEMPDDETIIWHIRHGVHWWNKPPVNGREFTAYDAEFGLNRDCFQCPKSASAGGKPEDRIKSITALDNYTLEWKVPSHVQGKHLLNSWSMRIYPPEVIETYGDMKDWKNVVGTGPYMLTDYVVGSSLFLEKNDNYWQYDPIHPENQLPYLDGIKELIIPDASSIAAAFRTGKLDMLWDQSYENFQLYMQQCPNLKYNQQFASSTFLVQPCGRVDKPELPFKDVRVRRALNLAVNQQEILEGYYQGKAALLGYPALPVASMSDIYTPLEEMPDSVQELFEYHPDKAKQLLAEAGYPNGFKTKIVCTSGQVDLLSIIREYLLLVGVDMEIQAGEGGMVTAMVKGRTHEEMCMAMHFPFSIYNMSTVIASDTSNPSFWESEETLATFDIVSRNLGKDDAKVAQALKGITPHILENAPYIFLPAPYAYTMWWPWVQNYHGETNVGSSSISNLARIYIWVDEELKKSMRY